jgi:hypothetical protein
MNHVFHWLFLIPKIAVQAYNLKVYNKVTMKFKVYLLCDLLLYIFLVADASLGVYH